MLELREKFYGCIVGAHVGSAMGAAVESMLYPEIEAKYGTLDHLVSYEHYNNGWKRLPGTTEDGIERQKLMITAMIEKKDRVNAEDVRAAWLKHIKGDPSNIVSEGFEGVLLKMAASGIPARDLGRYCDYAGLNCVARACHPLGLINAGDPIGARDDVLEVGQLYQTTNSRGLQWAIVTAVAIAEATKPGATVGSVIDGVSKMVVPYVWSELERGLEGSAHCKDFRELRTYFDNIYSGEGIPYAFASANEVVTKGLCIFAMTKGELFPAMISGVNMGRDTDCITAVASGISGALTGASSVPVEMIDQTNAATKANPHTNSQRTLRETSDGLLGAYYARMDRLQQWINTMRATKQ